MSRPEPAYARLRVLDAARLAFECSYSRDLTAALKHAIPFQARRWDAERKRWLIDPVYGSACADLARQYLGIDVDVPALPTQAPQIETRLIRLEYLGRCKERDTGEVTATGWADGAWSVIVAETVLRQWFEPSNEPDQAAPAGKPTLYGVLTVRPDAAPDELKSAYRRLARSNHPDVSKEPDTAERFIAIKAAYDVLSDPVQRKRYDVGLLFEQEASRTDRGLADNWPQLQRDGYAPPLRCGWVLVTGVQSVSGFVVQQILGWEPIVDGRGREMVTSWAAGAKHFDVRWVEP